MINMVHNDGATTIQLVAVQPGIYEVTLQSPDGRVLIYRGIHLETAMRDYTTAICAELGYYLGRDVAWFDTISNFPL